MFVWERESERLRCGSEDEEGADKEHIVGVVDVSVHASWSVWVVVVVKGSGAMGLRMWILLDEMVAQWNRQGCEKGSPAPRRN